MLDPTTYNVPETAWIKTWNQVHTILYSYIPFVLLVIANVMLVHQMAKRQKRALSKTRKNKHKSMTITILILTILFVVFTGISTVVTLLYSVLMSSYTGLVIAEIGDILGFSFHALNILTLLVSNRAFRHEFLVMVGIRKDSVHRASSHNESTSKFKPRL